MAEVGGFGDFEVKRANVRHHDVEAEIFEKVHPEGSSLYERSKVLKSLAYTAENSTSNVLSVDVGCGTGFVAGFELNFYRWVIAVDISRKMLEVARKRLGGRDSVSFIICDAESLPFKNAVADLVSVSSVLHHLPKPFNCLCEISRILKKNGYIYVTREPNFQRLRRFFDFLDHFIVRKILKIAVFIKAGERNIDINTRIDGLDYIKVDVHYPTGFQVSQLCSFLVSNGFKIVSSSSYHWIYPDSNMGRLQTVLTKSNFLIEKFPLTDRFGRYVSIIAKKTV